MKNLLWKSSSSSPSNPTGLPIAPWIFINDRSATNAPHIHTLGSMLPYVSYFEHDDASHKDASSADTCQRLVSQILSSSDIEDRVALIGSSIENEVDRARVAISLRKAAIIQGCNFVSINLYVDDEAATDQKDLAKLGPNHLEMQVSNDATAIEAAAKKILKWLFTVFTPHETLHLIKPSDLGAIDTPAFLPDYEYCMISDSRARHKSDKIQFIAVVLTRPEIEDGQKLTWQVADRSGIANFYYQYRTEDSQYTWDWVLALQPGNIKAFPRHPMVEVKERTLVQVAKAPLRGVGIVMAGLGRGLARVGNHAKMGQRSTWVSEEDIVDGKVVDWKKVFREQRVFARRGASGRVVAPPASDRDIKNDKSSECEKGEKSWAEEDGYASTEAGDAIDVVAEKEFC